MTSTGKREALTSEAALSMTLSTEASEIAREGGCEPESLPEKILL